MIKKGDVVKLHKQKGIVQEVVWDDYDRCCDLFILDKNILYPNGLKANYVYRWECDRPFMPNMTLIDGKMDIEDNLYL